MSDTGKKHILQMLYIYSRVFLSFYCYIIDKSGMSRNKSLGSLFLLSISIASPSHVHRFSIETMD